MKGHIFIIIGLIFLCSCHRVKNDYFQNESRVVKAKIIYNLRQIDENYVLNPAMAKPYFIIADYLKSSFDSILTIVDKGNKAKYQSGMEKLYSTIMSDSYFDSEYIKEIVIPNRFKIWADNVNNSRYWENTDILKLDLLNLENELISYLYNSIEADYYKFNKLQAIVVDSSENVKVGETYHANIFLAAEDTTVYPTIMVTDLSQPDSILLLNKPDNERLFLINAVGGKGVYKMKANKPGKHGFKGVVLTRNSNGEIERFMFSKEFMVRK